MTDELICEWGSVRVGSCKPCSNKATYLVIFHDKRPLILPFRDLNLLCEKHLKELKNFKIKKYNIYEIQTYHEKVQFT